MRTTLLLALLVAGCGGEGRCDQPPCQIPEVTCADDGDCFQSEVCDFERNTCGKQATDIGHCISRPSVCDDQLDPVCGCDGKFHGNACQAAVEGSDVNNAGGCPIPSGFFACGPGACDRASQLCVNFKSGGSDSFRCQQLPPECRNSPTCACAQQFGCQMCKETPGLTMTCELQPEPG